QTLGRAMLTSIEAPRRVREIGCKIRGSPAKVDDLPRLISQFKGKPLPAGAPAVREGCHVMECIAAIGGNPNDYFQQSGRRRVIRLIVIPIAIHKSEYVARLNGSDSIRSKRSRFPTR